MARTIQQLFNLTGKAALVTGGSGSLGLQMAHALGEAGARIMLSDLMADELETAMIGLHDAGIDARWVASDCAAEKDLEKLVSETRHRMGDVDILVNNPGGTWEATALDSPVNEWDRVMCRNVRTYFLLSQLIGKHCMMGRGGRIINVASRFNSLASHTSQGAVIHFTRALACDWRQYGVNVNAICAGGGTSNQLACTPDKVAEGRHAMATPLKRLGDDDDLKGATLLFASDAGKHITGQWLEVNGGACAVNGV